MSRKIPSVKKALQDALRNPQKRSSWRGSIGVVVFLLFIISSLAVNQAVQALNLSSGNYGYYSGTYGFNASTSSSDYLPNAPTSVTSSSIGSTTATISWTAPTLTTGGTSLDNIDYYSYAYSTSSTAPDNCDTFTNNGTDVSAALTGLSKNTTYYVAVCVTDDNDNDSAIATGTFDTSAGSSSSGGGGGGGGGGSSSSSSDSSDSSDAGSSVAVTEGESETASYSVGVATSLSVGSASHTVTVSAASESEATLTIESDPVTITVETGESEDIDTDSDGINDLRVAYNGLDDDGNPEFTFTELEVDLSCSMPSGTGTNPSTGEEEDITDLEAGDFIKSDSYATVYYVTVDCGRRVFMNSQTYFTWQDSFDTLVDVTDATLAELSLEGVMLPKAGTTMVKIESDPKVYWLTDEGDMFSPALMWVTSEDVAKGIAGSSWADYIIDIEPTYFNRFSDGDDVEDADDIDVDDDALKTRAELSK